MQLRQLSALSAVGVDHSTQEHPQKRGRHKFYVGVDKRAFNPADN